MVLKLSDPLWRKLDSAYGYLDIGDRIAALSEQWDPRTAADLFYGSLVHQGTCYSATYAAVPHLLAIAEPEPNRSQRKDIAAFLGWLTQNALEVAARGEQPLQQLPGLVTAREGWERKRQPYREPVAHMTARPVADERERLELYRAALAIEPPIDAELQRIVQVGTEYIASLDRIARLSRRAYLENLSELSISRHLLSAIAAGRGHIGLADGLEAGRVYGGLHCPHCRATIPFTSTIRKSFDLSASRGVQLDLLAVEPAQGDPRIAELIELADCSPDPDLGQLLRDLLDTVSCNKCGRDFSYLDRKLSLPA